MHCKFLSSAFVKELDFAFIQSLRHIYLFHSCFVFYAFCQRSHFMFWCFSYFIVHTGCIHIVQFFELTFHGKIFFFYLFVLISVLTSYILHHYIVCLLLSQEFHMSITWLIFSYFSFLGMVSFIITFTFTPLKISDFEFVIFFNVLFLFYFFLNCSCIMFSWKWNPFFFLYFRMAV